MKQSAGLWIDHRKAIVVRIENDEEMVQVIESNVEPRGSGLQTDLALPVPMAHRKLPPRAKGMNGTGIISMHTIAR
jgi:hypothetical protein